jgi:hypothetical protein
LNVSRNTGNKANGKAIERGERVNKALELRKAGCSFRVIAEQCGYKNAQRAHAAVKRALELIPRENALDVRRIEVERLDRLMLAAWERALKGDLDAGDYILRVMKRRAALLGIDAPTKTQVSGDPDGKPVQVATFGPDAEMKKI